ncbi:MAG TPA: hypothetical protein VFM99_07545 [Chitinophagales bacterium]|nr:hypothetical protein [Chitinophagales bacterium]
MGNWWEIASVFLLSTFKFVFGGVPLAMAYGFSFFESVVVTSLGGFCGVLLFVTLSDFILTKIRESRRRKEGQKRKNATKKNFSKKNRFIIHVKQRFGLIGIATLTPLLFSIPIGCFLATRYFKNKQRVIIYMFGSILFWSVSLSAFKLLF